MSKNPFYNALAAVTYITLVVSVMNFVSGNENIESTLLMPIMILSLFTLSVAVMGYVFFYQPVRLFLDGKKEEAVSLFTKTLAIFSVIPFSIALFYFLKILS